MSSSGLPMPKALGPFRARTVGTSLHLSGMIEGRGEVLLAELGPVGLGREARPVPFDVLELARRVLQGLRTLEALERLALDTSLSEEARRLVMDLLRERA